VHWDLIDCLDFAVLQGWVSLVLLPVLRIPLGPLLLGLLEQPRLFFSGLLPMALLYTVYAATRCASLTLVVGSCYKLVAGATLLLSSLTWIILCQRELCTPSNVLPLALTLVGHVAYFAPSTLLRTDDVMFGFLAGLSLGLLIGLIKRSLTFFPSHPIRTLYAYMILLGSVFVSVVQALRIIFGVGWQSRYSQIPPAEFVLVLVLSAILGWLANWCFVMLLSLADPFVVSLLIVGSISSSAIALDILYPANLGLLSVWGFGLMCWGSFEFTLNRWRATRDPSPRSSLGASHAKWLGGRVVVAVVVTLVLMYAHHRAVSVTVTSSALSPPPQTSKYHAVIYFLVHSSRVEELTEGILPQLDAFFNDRYHYPILVLEDELSDAHKFRIRSATRSHVLFHTIDWFRDQRKDIPRDTCGNTHGMGYRHMCRLHAYEVFKVLRKLGFHWYWRLDTDSMLPGRIPYDPFDYLSVRNKSFGYVLVDIDNHPCLPSLWNLTVHFLSKEGQQVSLPDEYWDSLNKRYNNHIVYNNFEVAEIAFWDDSMSQQYFETIEKSNGIYLNRWGDAPIHTLAAYLWHSWDKIAILPDFPYAHQARLSPQGTVRNVETISPFAL